MDFLLQRDRDPRLRVLPTEELHQHEVVPLDYHPLQTEPQR
jgi:hypothetical protein